jgi:5S rRNA maturation endonuclease (ribonuclease M5)
MRAFERMVGELELRDRQVRYLGQSRAMAQCPAHHDRTPSLSITEQADGKVLVHCHAGCETEDVLAAIGLEKRDLFSDDSNGNRDEDAVYRYLDEHGKPLFEVVRFPGKQFRQRLPDGRWGLNGTRRVLYRLPKVIEAVACEDTIYVVEGEKDVHALEKLGVAATCNPGGAGKWRDDYSQALRGGKVVIVADRDDPGRDHARQVAESLRGVAAEVTVLEPPRAKDVSDHLASGSTLEELQILSATRESAVAESISGLPFTLAGDVIADAPPEPAWIWEGYVAPGEVSLIAGRPKVGKSTLVFGLIAAILHGRPFVGRSTRGRGVLLLTEEGATTFAEKARAFGIANHPRFHVLLRRQVQASWPEVVGQARAYCREHDLDVMIVDTFDKWAGLRGDDENKSGPVLQALDPLMQASGDGLAVIVVSHQRKAAGDHGEAVRGSNAITGTVDVIVEIERVADVAHARALVGTSRHTATPEELAVELTDDGYVDRGDVDALKGRLEGDQIMAVLSTQPVTSKEIAEATEIPEATVRRRLDELHGDGRVERTGEGRKGSPYRWKMLSATPNPLVAERKETRPEGDTPPAGLIEGVGGAQGGVEIGTPATDAEEAEAKRVLKKFAKGAGTPFDQLIAREEGRS